MFTKLFTGIKNLSTTQSSSDFGPGSSSGCGRYANVPSNPPAYTSITTTGNSSSPPDYSVKDGMVMTTDDKKIAPATDEHNGGITGVPLVVKSISVPETPSVIPDDYIISVVDYTRSDLTIKDVYFFIQPFYLKEIPIGCEMGEALHKRYNEDKTSLSNDIRVIFTNSKWYKYTKGDKCVVACRQGPIFRFLVEVDINNIAKINGLINIFNTTGYRAICKQNNMYYFRNDRYETRCTIKNFEKHGLVYTYNLDKQLIEITTFKNGKIDGKHISLYPSDVNNYKQVVTIDDTNTNTNTNKQTLHVKGCIKCIMYYKQGELHGPCIIYEMTGCLTSEENYVDGIYDGEQKYYKYHHNKLLSVDTIRYAFGTRV